MRYDLDVDDFSFVALVAAGAFGLRMLWRRGPAAAKPMWDRAARLVGGEHTIERGEHGLRLEVEGIPLLVRARSETIGRSASRRTIASATLPRGARTTLAVGPRETWGGQQLPAVTDEGSDVRTGDAAFDAEFCVSASPEALVGELLDARARRLLLETREGFVIEEGELRIEREDEPDDVESLVGFVRFAADIVRAWHDVVGGTERIASALGWGVELEGVFDAEADAHVARGVRRGVACELVVRFREAWALVVVRVASTSSSVCSLVRDPSSSPGWTGMVPDTLHAIALGAPRPLVGIRQTDDALELAFDGLDVDPTAVIPPLDAVLDATATSQPYR